MTSYVKKILNLIFLNKFEKKFINNYDNIPSKKTSKSKNDKKIIMFQTPMDYYFLLMTRSIIAEKYLNTALLGSWPYYIKPLKIRNKIFIELLDYLKNVIVFWKLKSKWKKIYAKNNINLIKDFSLINLNSITFSIKNFRKIANQVKSKNDILKLKFKGIYIGDLIYDTYVRYRAIPHVIVNDFYLKYIIFRTLLIYYNSINFIKKNNIQAYYTSYSSYINHGLLVRILLLKKVKVYALPRNYGNNYVNLLSIKHPYSKKYYNNLLTKFKSEKNPLKKINYSNAELNKRFFGKGDKLTKYIKFKANYKPTLIKDFNFEGVVFLHDFYDAPHEMGLRLFTDLYEWFDFLNYTFKKNELNFAFKFHPNNKPESKIFNNFLKKKYNCNFLDSKISNTEIFKSKKFNTGISVCGSVLYELLYFKKIPLYLSENLISPLNIHKLPKNKDEYEKLIVNHKKIKISNKMIKDMLKIYYMALNDQSSFECTIAKKVRLKDSSFLNPSNLDQYIKKIEPEIKKFYFKGN